MCCGMHLAFVNRSLLGSYTSRNAPWVCGRGLPGRAGGSKNASWWSDAWPPKRASRVLIVNKSCQPGQKRDVNPVKTQGGNPVNSVNPVNPVCRRVADSTAEKQKKGTHAGALYSFHLLFGARRIGQVAVICKRKPATRAAIHKTHALAPLPLSRHTAHPQAYTARTFVLLPHLPHTRTKEPRAQISSRTQTEKSLSLSYYSSSDQIIQADAAGGTSLAPPPPPFHSHCPTL
jgi:hypothetical protein